MEAVDFDMDVIASITHWDDSQCMCNICTGVTIWYLLGGQKISREANFFSDIPEEQTFFSQK